MVSTDDSSLGSWSPLVAARQRLDLPLGSNLFRLTSSLRRLLQRLRQLRCQSLTAAVAVVMVATIIKATTTAGEVAPTHTTMEGVVVAGDGKDLHAHLLHAL
jgi:hypothetical protein